MRTDAQTTIWHGYERSLFPFLKVAIAMSVFNNRTQVIALMLFFTNA
ncbi:hypothetical protein OGM63_04135 [Plectonema radiosum NIES-515]|uniref:Uncharacterized protein n=1 Tax=Plectonema radiosum NIES-515 TaxID=2986073 RepID=A0ABT3AUD2_9CYAN|nr:hypothetical protein [Plectonema radiosum]MCV3212722.1 hypothetical protein [Plectonema radiosum NIES-515]